MTVTAATDHQPDSLVGLTAAAVADRVRLGETNDYRPPSSRSVREIVRANVFTRFNALLGGLLVAILVVGPLQDSLFGLTILANTAIGIVQELRSKRTLDRLTVIVAPRASVIRDGQEQSIDARHVVRDDLMRVSAGDQIVVDGVVLATAGVDVDESMLTGESHPVTKQPGDTLLSGSFVTAGSAQCRVTEIGARAYAARLTSEAREFTLARSELRDGMNRILRVVTWVLVPVAALLIWSQFSRHAGFADAVRGSVAGTVTMVPEGLVLLTSVAFAVGSMRLARHRVLTRELPSLEGLARVDTLCIDKTGTLTTGQLSVEGVEVLEDSPELPAAIGALARLEDRPNATMTALGQRYDATSPRWPATTIYPFDSATKWSGGDFGVHGFWLLGAPDVLVPAGPVRVRSDDLAARGLRVLLVARSTGPPAPGTHVTPMALVTLVDEIRADAARTLAYLAEQGVDVKVISGDHPDTVAAIAARVGLDPGLAVDSRSLADADALRLAVAEHRVFGRTTPAQKQSMVRELRDAGHVVAMTGDGVNDVLAMKESDVGIAMGAGASATRAVAQLVLLDNAFTAVPTIIGEGRRIIANMERVANLFITKTVYATLLAVTVGIARLPFPFLPRHLTLVSTLTIGIPAFFLALAPNARRARPHFVARVTRFALPAGLVAAGATYLAYTQAREDAATSTAQGRTLATVVLFAVALWILAILVRLGDRKQDWIVPTMAAALLAVLAVPPLRTFFAMGLPRPLVLMAGVGVAALSGVTLELGWRVAGWLQPRRPRLHGEAANRRRRSRET